MAQTWTAYIKIQGVPVRVSGSYAHVMAAVRANMPDATRSREKLAPGLAAYFAEGLKDRRR